MLFELNVSHLPMIKKKSSHMRTLSNDDMKITVKDIEQVKERLQELSQHSINF